MKGKFQKVIPVLILFLFLSGCATSASNLKKVSLGMTKDQVEESLGGTDCGTGKHHE